METEKYEELREKLEKALEKFEKKFNVKLDWTGYTIEDEDRLSEEYWVIGLIESKTDAINVEVGGWFELTEDGNGSCNLTILINGKNALENKALVAYYENGEWSDLELEDL